MAAKASIKLGYWKIRGLAQPARTLMAYADVPFEVTVLHEHTASCLRIVSVHCVHIHVNRVLSLSPQSYQS
jgi:hypothetical protein